MSEKKRILFAGESWTSYTTHVKGFDTFVSCVYEEGVEFIAAAIQKAGYELDYLPGQYVAERFPRTAQELSKYACVVLSDIGSNTLLLSDETLKKSAVCRNRCESIRDYVLAGGAFLMIGGYLSFSGIDAKARYGSTAVREILPVRCLMTDDREEHPEGVFPVISKEHPVLKGIQEFPHFLGYNKTLPAESCEVIVTVCGDPLLAFGRFGKGKSAAFTSDCAPHWGPLEFVNWEHYNLLWKNIFDYLTT